MNYKVPIYNEKELERKGPDFLKNLDWSYQMENGMFSNEFIYKYRDYITDWISVSRYQRLKINTIKRLASYVDWHEIATRQILTEKFIEKYQDFMSWEDISLGQDLSEEFIEKYAAKVDWSEISYKNYLTIPFIRKYKDKIIWGNFCQVYRTHYKNWDFIREFAEYLNWDEIYEHIWERLKKSIKLIREFQNYLPWEQVTEDLVLKKDLLREFRDHISYIYQEDYYDHKMYREFREKLICEDE